MAVIIADATALAILRAVPPQAHVLQPVDRSMRVADISTSPASLDGLDPERYGITGPVHVISAKGATRPTRAGVRVHRTSFEEFPADTLLQLAPDVYICGPELVFMQMAQHLSFAARVVLGHELCGDYSQFSRMISGFYDRPALTTTERIERVSSLFPKMPGVGLARAALRYVRNGSRSPMETVVGCMLFLPASEGGYGFVQPSLNYEVALDAAARNMIHKKTCYIDTAFPEQLIGLEYDSDLAHADPERDRRRREALTHMGWTMHALKLSDVRSFDSLDRMVGLFAERVPKARPAARPSVTAQRRLLKSLFVYTRFGLGMDSVLFGVPLRRGSVEVHL